MSLRDETSTILVIRVSHFVTIHILSGLIFQEIRLASLTVEKNKNKKEDDL